MKLKKVIGFCIISLAMLSEANASRIKKDLLTLKENEIVELLEKKIVLVDKLITEAKIYKKETDPLIKKNFYNTASIFVTGSSKRSKDIFTNGKNQGKIEKAKPSQKGAFAFSTTKGINFDNSRFKRDIFTIPMQRKKVVDSSFKSNMNFSHILNSTLRKKVRRNYKKKVDNLFNSAYKEKLETPIRKLFEKYIEAISLLSSDEIAKELVKLKITDKKYFWEIYSRIFFFEFNLNSRDDSFKKRVYESSQFLDDTFKKLEARENITLTTPSKYYDKKISKNLKCIETAKEVKYKGKICINNIEVDQDKYFDYGTFETKENNFVLENQEIFEALVKLDKELEKSAREYVKHLLVKAKDIEIKETTKQKGNEALNIEGGL
jgi:hypothetical protein